MERRRFIENIKFICVNGDLSGSRGLILGFEAKEGVTLQRPSKRQSLT